MVFSPCCCFGPYTVGLFFGWKSVLHFFVFSSFLFALAFDHLVIDEALFSSLVNRFTPCSSTFTYLVNHAYTFRIFVYTPCSSAFTQLVNHAYTFRIFVYTPCSSTFTQLVNHAYTFRIFVYTPCSSTFTQLVNHEYFQNFCLYSVQFNFYLVR